MAIEEHEAWRPPFTGPLLEDVACPECEAEAVHSREDHSGTPRPAYCEACHAILELDVEEVFSNPRCIEQPPKVRHDQEQWYASGRGIFSRDAGFQLGCMPVTVNWQEDTARLVALLNAGQACLDWARNTGDCHICNYDRAAGNPHEEHCPLREIG